MNRLRLQNESGFTLIELLVVVAIIGILAAIAIPQFAAYRKRGHEAQVKSDLRNAAVAEEAYFAAQSAYKSSSSAWTGGASPTVPGFNTTTGVDCVFGGWYQHVLVDGNARELRYQCLDFQ